MLKQIGESKKYIKPWVIYLWRNGDKYEGASPVVTKDGLKEVFCHGWEIEKDYEAKRNEDKHQAWRAKTKVKNLLNNTLNVINWYGKKVLDEKGNIDTSKLRMIEAENTLRIAKQNQRTEQLNKSLSKDKKVETLSLDDIYPIRKFPVREISVSEAYDYGFTGNNFNKHINKTL